MRGHFHSLHTGGVTGSIPVAPTIEIKYLTGVPEELPARTRRKRAVNMPLGYGRYSCAAFGVCSGRRLA